MSVRASDLAKEMRQFVGGAYFITLKELTQYLGRKDEKAVKAKYLIGLNRIDKMYSIAEVAAALIERGRNIA